MVCPQPASSQRGRLPRGGESFQASSNVVSCKHAAALEARSVVCGRLRPASIDQHSSDRTKTDASAGYSVGPMAHGANSSSPTPWASLLVFSPPATATIFSKIWRPTSSTETPSRITPALISMSSTIRSYMGVFVAILIDGAGLQPKQLPRPVVKTTTLQPPASKPVTDAGS